MNRGALEHILRAASAIANEREFVVWCLLDAAVLEERLNALPLPEDRIHQLPERLTRLAEGV
jgi:hypothetical protein